MNIYARLRVEIHREKAVIESIEKGKRKNPNREKSSAE
jgi:hypothetical protein